MNYDEKINIKGATAAVILAVCLLAVAASAFSTVTRHNDTIFTLTDDGSGLLYLTVDGDDHFTDYLKTGSDSNAGFNRYLEDNVTCGRPLSAFGTSSCSVFLAGNSVGNGYLVGRNYDYHYSMPCAVYCKGNGSDTYSSISTVDLSMFCDTDEAYSAMVNDTRLNAVSYVPLDGMNEKGVFACVNGVGYGPNVDQHNEGKIDIYATSCLRLVLDYADSAFKAAELISGCNLHASMDSHMFVCDNTGAGYAVEFIGDKTYIIETKFLTTHYITEDGKDVPVNPYSSKNYATLDKALSDNPAMDKELVKTTLESVSMSDPDLTHYTRWSVIYDLDSKDVTIYLRAGTVMDYEHGITYSLNGR